MNENSKNGETNKSLEESEQLLIESKISEQMVLEHPSYKQLADHENLKRRTEREVANAHKYALDKFAYEILTVVDNLERSLVTKVSDNEALKDFYIGIELTLKSLLEILQRFGITTINPLGEIFDPEKHTAVTTKEDPAAKPNIVLEVVQKGYWLKDRLLRPALVVVAK